MGYHQPNDNIPCHYGGTIYTTTLLYSVRLTDVDWFSRHWSIIALYQKGHWYASRQGTELTAVSLSALCYDEIPASRRIL